MTASKKVPEWLLERLAQRELSPEKEAEIKERLGGEEEARRQVALLQESDREILAAYPPRAMAAKIQQRLGRGASSGISGWLFLAAPVAAALLLLVAFFGPTEEGPAPLSSPAPQVEETREKGLMPQLRIYRKKGDEVERLSPGALAREHDLLQLSYVAAGARFGVIFSIDGRGVLTRHFPEAHHEAAPLSPQGEVALPHAYELDDAPGFERFFFITAEAPFGLETVLKAGHLFAKNPKKVRDGSLALPPGLKQVSFIIEKEGR